jgi:hypothetical protein
MGKQSRKINQEWTYQSPILFFINKKKIFLLIIVLKKLFKKNKQILYKYFFTLRDIQNNIIPSAVARVNKIFYI